MSQDAETPQDDGGTGPAGDGSLPDVPPRIVGLFDLVKAGLWVVLWLIPILYVNSTNSSVAFDKLTLGVIERRNPLSLYLNHEYRVSCLFTNSVVQWKNLYAQVQLSGQEAWISFDERHFAPMHCFGYRTRIKRMYMETSHLLNTRSHRKAKNLCMHCKRLVQRREDMASFIGRRYEELHPGETVSHVRFVQVSYRVGSEETAKPDGHWEVPSLDLVPEKRRRVVSTHEVAE